MRPVITDEDVEGLVEALNTGREAWISGRIGSSADGSIIQDEDMTLFAPFGGEVIRGLGDLQPRQQRAVSQFQGGTGTSEVVKTIVVGDVVIVVMVDRDDVRFEGRDEPHPGCCGSPKSSGEKTQSGFDFTGMRTHSSNAGRSTTHWTCSTASYSGDGSKALYDLAAAYEEQYLRVGVQPTASN